MRTTKRILNSKSAFEEFLQSTVRPNYSASLPLGSHGWTFTDDDGLRINAVSGAQDFLHITLGQLYEGDQTTIEFEQRVISGAATYLILQTSVDGVTYSDTGLYLLDDQAWHAPFKETYTMTPAVSGRYVRWAIGVGTSTVSEFVIRGVEVTVKALPRADIVKVRETRHATLTKTAGVWGLLSTYANDAATVTVVGNDIVITWTTPIPSTTGVGSLKPVVQATFDYVNDGWKHGAFSAGSTTSETRLRVWDKTVVASTPVDPTTLTDGQIIHVTVDGFYYTTPLT